MTTRKASCSCGQLTLEVSGEPVRISMCHCLACQRRTGSTYGAQARFPTADVRIQGRSTTWVRTAESGNQLTFSFCPDCGATVYYRVDAVPEITGVPIGAFADPVFPAPKFSVWESMQHAWVSAPADAERSR
ncbi:MAG TPA: GFA family protein [Polyangiales bacterium]|nr:GFA family protein [Polyangiales bacterium]